MLDLRQPIAYFFLINAAVLVIYGLLQPSTVPFGAQQINLNLIWGLVMGAFGGFMYSLVFMDKQREKATAKSASGDKSS
jgi:hypothetical protein